ncbi:MAG: DUF5675 family protein [Parvibaculum sp.]|uniref:DUF5675 family protein n=1 Tax=Parvibaculum sp. TaxID=2024848 RepID=UPI002730F911|nr:DUF5675 family protein [Parvibaculum sp.]MDP1628872.1 DUF5675 family protein [Parvibaculum sp.]MDP2148267.1 DUF5675 family protein [Parvibaculum sp.]
MHLRLDRTASDAQSTLGKLYLRDIEGAPGEGETWRFLCWTCEDEHRDEKVMHETRIPVPPEAPPHRGVYRLALKPKGSSRFDAGYTKRFGEMHAGMIELRDVPGFTGVLIHIGNTERDTSGCILLGTQWGHDERGHYKVVSSEAAYRRVYPILRDALKAGETVTLGIRDLDRK